MPATPPIAPAPRSPAGPRWGAAAGAAVAGLCLAYTVVLAAGLLTLPSPDRPIQPPWFTLMEILIIAIAPALVMLSIAVHAGAPAAHRPAALAGVVFMALCAGLTCSVHFAILTLGRQPEFADAAWARQVFAFEWPSLAYALDILAWDVFFAFGALGTAAAVRGPGLARRARMLMRVGALLSLAGLAGVPLADMQVRNVGIVGYAVVYPLAAALLAVHLHGLARGTPAAAGAADR